MDKMNNGALWANDEKLTDKHPDFKGNYTDETGEYWVAMWKSTSTNPKAPDFKFTLTKKTKKPKEESKPKEGPFNDDVPF